MSRREIVLLVSRAIALLLAVDALFNSVLILPEQVFFIAQRLLRLRSASAGIPIHLTANEWMIDPIFLLVRIAVLWWIASLFWRCGPAIERLLLPTGSTVEE